MHLSSLEKTWNGQQGIYSPFPSWRGYLQSVPFLKNIKQSYWRQRLWELLNHFEATTKRILDILAFVVNHSSRLETQIDIARNCVVILQNCRKLILSNYAAVDMLLMLKSPRFSMKHLTVQNNNLITVMLELLFYLFFPREKRGAYVHIYVYTPYSWMRWWQTISPEVQNWLLVDPFTTESIVRVLVGKISHSCGGLASQVCPKKYLDGTW